MLKSKTMRAAALLLALTLITCCFVGGTFAKYISTFNGTDSTRIAYWGFTGGTMDLDLFDETYDGTVDSAEDGVNVVAPGTKKTSAPIKFVYNEASIDAIDAPEVDYTLDIDVTVPDYDTLTIFNWGIPFTIEYGETKIECVDVWDLEEQFERLALNTDGSKVWKAGTLPAFLEPGTEVKISWEWPFEAEENVAANNNMETYYYGNRADTISAGAISISITATQID